MRKRKIIQSVAVAICIISSVFTFTGCACSSDDSTNLANDTFIYGDFHKVDKDYIKNTGLIIGNYEIVLPVLVDELPFDKGLGVYEVAYNKPVPNDSKIKPNQIIRYTPLSTPSADRIKDGTYYAYNDTASDNMPSLCRAFAVCIETKYLDDNKYIQIGPDRITKNTSYRDACIILRNNVSAPEYYKENLHDSKDKYSVAYYNDMIVRVIYDSLEENNAKIVMRVDVDINDANNLVDIPWGV